MAAMEERYQPPPEFQEDAKESLLDLHLTDSSEMWLIQWPKNQNPDFDGQELTLKLQNDGNLGSFKGLSGKEYDVVSFQAQEPNATVFVSSESGTKVVGKISRRVSLVHYPEPEELEQRNVSNLKQMYQNSASISMSKSSRSRSGRPASSSRNKSALSDVGEPSRAPTTTTSTRHVPKTTRSSNHSAQSSGRGHSAVTISGSSELSHKGKSKKRKKNED